MTASRSKLSEVFNRVVRRVRLELELSQEALAEKASVDRTYVGLLERGLRTAGSTWRRGSRERSGSLSPT
jgi:transcriptional regulator with XRE-family HTH domain